jgi:hypothetical protein
MTILASRRHSDTLGLRVRTGYAFALANASTLVSDTDAAKGVAACDMQLSRDLAPDWNMAPPSVILIPHKNVQAALARHYIVLVLRDQCSAPGALGDHSVDETGWPIGEIGVQDVFDDGGTVHGPNGVFSVVSHELGEITVDPYIDEWIDMSGDGTAQMAKEAYDPVQGDGYVVGGVYVGNYVRPNYFDLGWAGDATPGTFDKMGSLAQPFGVAPNGYAVTRAMGNGAWNYTNVFGSKVSDAQKARYRERRRVRLRHEPHALGMSAPSPAP